jgi:hypothetical protein
MKKYLLSASVVTLIATAACTTLTAPEETKSLKYATSVFTTAIGDLRSARTKATAALQWESNRSIIARGGSINIESGCRDPVLQWKAEFDRAFATPSDWRNVDAVYARRLTLPACDFEDQDILPEPQRSIEPSLVDPNHSMSVQTADLAAVTQHLNNYVEALADIAAGESSAATDAARAKAATAGIGLAGALDSSGVAGAVLGTISQVANSLIAARRNAETRAFLREMDQAMPDLMEQLGLAARLEVARALVDRASAAYIVANYGNRAMAQTARRRGAAARVDPERLRRFDEIATQLESHNSAFRQLRLSDPMIAARGFAKSHRALTAVFNDPRRNRIAFLTAFQTFQASANALVEALQKANDH